MHEQPGVTRDRKEVEADWNGRRLHAGRHRRRRPRGRATSWPARSARQAGRRCAEAELAVLRGRRARGPAARRRGAGRELRGGPVPVVVVANKVDSAAAEGLAAEFYGLGLGEPLPGLGDAGARHRRPARPDRRARLPERGGEAEDDAVRLASDRAAERGQVVARQPPAGRGARDRHAGRRHHARRDRHPHRGRRARGRRWWTRPGLRRALEGGGHDRLLRPAALRAGGRPRPGGDRGVRRDRGRDLARTCASPTWR